MHKLWKARLHGYEEAIKIFSEIDDEKSSDWNKFHGLIKKFVTDSHAMAQERGLEATLIYVENCGHAGKVAGDVMSGIVSKCIAAPKAKTKDLATQVALMFIEIEKQDIVLEELVKGMEQKNPKIVAGSTAIVKLALNKFGNKVVTLKPLIKQIPVLLGDRDKNVRDEGKLLIVEIFRYAVPREFDVSLLFCSNYPKCHFSVSGGLASHSNLTCPHSLLSFKPNWTANLKK